MLKLEDIMTRRVQAVTPDVSIRQVMMLLSEQHISGVPVISEGRLVGVVSMTDLVAFAAELDQSREIPSVEQDADRDESSNTDQTPSYFTDFWRDEATDLVTRFETTDTDAVNSLDTRKVGEVMTTISLLTLPPGTPVVSAAEIMTHAQVHRVLVVEDGRLKGIVSASDIVGAVAERRLGSRTFVFPRHGTARAP